MKLGNYGTFIWAEQESRGNWRFQTDHQPLYKYMKKLSLKKRSPWSMVGWGTSFIFRAEFDNKRNAKRSVQNILDKLGIRAKVVKEEVLLT